jgi:hypothetical protein
MHKNNSSHCRPTGSPARRNRFFGLLVALAVIVALPLRASTAGVWTSIGPAGAAVHSLVASDGVLYAATGRGIQSSMDGGHHWRTLNSGLDLNALPTVLAVDPQNTSLLYAGGSLLSRSFDGGATWQTLPFSCGQTLQILVAPSRPRTLYVSVLQAGHPSVFKLAKSVDRGETWSCEDSPFSDGATFVVDPSDPETLFAGTAGIFKSTKSGAPGSWFQVLHAVAPLDSIGAMAIDPSAPDTVYAAGNGAVAKSVTSGRPWKVSSAGLPQPVAGTVSLNLRLDNILVDPNDPSTLYTGASGVVGEEGIADGGIGVFESHDAGVTWTHISRGLPRPSFNGVLALDSTTGVLYAGTSNRGIYVFTPSAPSAP